jgi:cell division protein FtsQ
LKPENVPLSRVRIDGDIRHTRQELLRAAIAQRLHGSFFGLDLQGVRKAVESLPWVTQASVRRVWPGTLVIRVEERSALARWGEKAVVSPQGEVFVPDAGSVPAGLALIHGPEGSEGEVVQRYRWMQARLAPFGMAIAALRLSERHAWTLELANGMRVHLGNGELERRMDRFLAQVPALLQRGSPELVDLRYSNGLAVRWGPPPQEQEQQTGAEG